MRTVKPREVPCPRVTLAAIIAAALFGPKRSGLNSRTATSGAAYWAASVRHGPPWPLPAPASSQDSRAAAAKDPEAEAAEAQAKAAADWRKRLEQARQEEAAYTDTVNKVQLALNDTSNLYNPGRQANVTLLEDTQKKLADVKTRIADLEAEGRRNNYH